MPSPRRIREPRGNRLACPRTLPARPSRAPRRAAASPLHMPLSRSPENTTFTRRHRPPSWPASTSGGQAPPATLNKRLLAGAELLQRLVGVPDGLWVVAEELAGHRSPARAGRRRLHGRGHDPSMAGLCLGLSRCRSDDYANANRTGCDCHDKLPHGCSSRFGRAPQYHTRWVGSRSPLLVRRVGDKRHHLSAA
jgi:hypothetical protein